ncbi:hypothetical protein Z043_101202, partial [Scleropages formosus]
MNTIWSTVKSHPYIINIVGYTTLFATADVIQQSMVKHPGGKAGHLRRLEGEVLDLLQNWSDILVNYASSQFLAGSSSGTDGVCRRHRSGLDRFFVSSSTAERM